MKSNLYLNNFNVWDSTYENDIEKVESLNEAAEDDPNHIRPHYIGHRKRVKQRLINAGGASGFSDYELLELILFSAIPRKDVKPLAKKLLEKFKNLTNLISLDKDKLLSISGTNENLYVNFAVMRELINKILKQRITNKNIIGSWGALVDYLKVTMSSMPLEQFRILFLNKKIF